MKTIEEYTRIANEQSQELYNILNGIDWSEAESKIKDLKDAVICYFIDNEDDFIDLDYKDINIGLFKDDNNKISFPEQNVEVWNEEENKYYSILSFS